MNQKVQIRMARLDDVDALLQIYAPYCENTEITFEYEVPTREEFIGRMKKILTLYPYLVALKENKIVGYAYASRHKERAAYQWNVETSIYIDRKERGCGIGTLLYEKLFDYLRRQNIRNAYACITLPNKYSEKIHKKYGFELIGRFHNTGYKLGKWHDVGWFEKHLEAECEEPKPVIPITELITDIDR